MLAYEEVVSLAKLACVAELLALFVAWLPSVTFLIASLLALSASLAKLAALEAAMLDTLAALLAIPSSTIA